MYKNIYFFVILFILVVKEACPVQSTISAMQTISVQVYMRKALKGEKDIDFSYMSDSLSPKGFTIKVIRNESLFFLLKEKDHVIAMARASEDEKSISHIRSPLVRQRMHHDILSKFFKHVLLTYINQEKDKKIDEKEKVTPFPIEARLKRGKSDDMLLEGEPSVPVYSPIAAKRLLTAQYDSLEAKVRRILSHEEYMTTELRHELQEQYLNYAKSLIDMFVHTLSPASQEKEYEALLETLAYTKKEVERHEEAIATQIEFDYKLKQRTLESFLHKK